jgi:hypothetical protein
MLQTISGNFPGTFVIFWVFFVEYLSLFSYDERRHHPIFLGVDLSPLFGRHVGPGTRILRVHVAQPNSYGRAFFFFANDLETVCR